MRWPSGEAEGACAKEWESHLACDALKILTLSEQLWEGRSIGLSLSLSLYPGPLRDTFQPVYPERLWVEEEVFCDAFPFHIVFDEAVRDPFPQKLGIGDKSVWGGRSSSPPLCLLGLRSLSS